MNFAISALRIFFGLHFLVNGLNFFFDFFPVDPGMPKIALDFVAMLVSSGLIDIVKFVEVGVGIALLANRFVPLAIVAAMPVSIGVAYMDMVLIGGWFVGGVLGFGTLLLNALLALAYFSYFRPLLAFRAAPGFALMDERTK
ncbi:MAG: hypothetical protein RL481_2419 [Pseudomonadota bacterium]|jgi:hypothetical protein